MTSCSRQRPLLLDLFSGAGGAAMGYHRAGFEVVGVDIEPQPRYPFEFLQGDALAFLTRMWRDPEFMHDVVAIHASPPCQGYTQAQRLRGNDHPDLLPRTRDLLIESGLPYVIENVPGAPMENYVQVCGKALGLDVKRHRWFESNCLIMGTPCGSHSRYLTVFGHDAEWRPRGTRRDYAGAERAKQAMGTEWMNRDEMAEAVPPAYTEYVGGWLLQHLNRSGADVAADGRIP